MFSALSRAEWFSPLVTESKTYISIHCLLLLQEKPPARVSFTSVSEEQWSVELLLWRQHVFFTQQDSQLVFTENIDECIVSRTTNSDFCVQSEISTENTFLSYQTLF